ncbi:MAG: transposase, partial [Chloroflexales bacterium]|nr:transposase [Chloroflexales bacterium]
KKYDLQRAIYQQIREQFGLSAQLAIRVIAKVADAYKLDKRTERTFRSLGSVAFDDRILSYNLPAKQVSIWTLDGRLKIAFAAGERQMQLLQTRQGESDLVFHRGGWYLLATCEIPEPTPEDVDGVLGVDLGIVTIATDSDGTTHSGQQVETKRQWYANRRHALQKVGAKSAKRRLKRLSGRQRRFQKDTNSLHCEAAGWHCKRHEAGACARRFDAHSPAGDGSSQPTSTPPQLELWTVAGLYQL